MKTSSAVLTKDSFWSQVLLAIGIEPQSSKHLRGGSGLEHELIAYGVDERSKRVAVVSAEHNGRVTALVQTDIQAAYPSYRVLSIRPASVSIPKIAQALQAIIGSNIITQEVILQLNNAESPIQSTLAKSFNYFDGVKTNVQLKMLPQVLELIQQLARLNFTTGELGGADGGGKFEIDFSSILNYDPIAADRLVGVCGFPLYDFTADSIETIASATSSDIVAELLSKRDIYQYFFPGPDQIALGLIDRGIHKPTDIKSELQRTPSLGHPLGQMEILDPNTSPLEIIDALHDRKLVVEGEYGIEVSDEGKKARMTVKFKPKEGLISKLIGQFSLRVDLKDLLGK